MSRILGTPMEQIVRDLNAIQVPTPVEQQNDWLSVPTLTYVLIYIDLICVVLIYAGIAHKEY